eukprot:TRINITY_DN11748_c0_g1_i1.p1 TRINITY_DN11748_c0_g1~~TRINITY_DN11748_c0_g1_i1.p1  ORF type:complete len:239 (+),score=21.82 TRINITY_DN11748_c0_g1_i1:138-854(+)
MSNDWPVDILRRFLHFLALDGEDRSWSKLAFLTRNDRELLESARRMQRPMVIQIAFSFSAKAKLKQYPFTIPFTEAKVANIAVDWGDGSSITVHEGAAGSLRHDYAEPGGYCVRVFPSQQQREQHQVALDHLGGQGDANWWKPLRCLKTLGSLGISSLANLFRLADGFNQPLAHLNVSGVTTMRHMFLDARAFNQHCGLTHHLVEMVESGGVTLSHAASYIPPPKQTFDAICLLLHQT